MVAASKILFSTSDKLSKRSIEVAKADIECLSPTAVSPYEMDIAVTIIATRSHRRAWLKLT